MNPIVHGGSGSAQSIYQASPIKNHSIGTRGYSQDGRVWYYASNDTANSLVAGDLLCRAQLVANHQNLATATTALVVGDTVATDVTLGATLSTANQYAEGFMAVASDGGIGQYYKVKGHEAIASAGTGDFQLYDSISIASDASTTVSLHVNPFKNPIVSPTTDPQVDIPAGVAQTAVGAGNTDEQFFWVQTWGECAVKGDEAVAAGKALTIGTGTAGAVEGDDTATTVFQEFIVGYAVAAAVADETQLVYLQIRA